MTEEIFKYKVKFLETINNTHSKAISSRYIDSYDLEFDKNHKMIAINELIEEGLLTSQSATILLSPKGKIVVKEGYLKVKEKEAEQAKKEKEYQDNIRILAAQQVASFNTQNTYSTNFTTKQLSHQEFEELINSDENSYLDFKMKMYDFENDDSELTKLGKFAKDVISMICTIKVKSSYIITGIGINADGTKNLIGMNFFSRN